MSVWDHYFQFPAGSTFEIDGPWGYNGTGRVETRTDDVLEITLDLPRWGPAPAFHATLRVEFYKDGDGNTVIIRHKDGRVTTDSNATIRSDDGRRERAISSKDITCSVRYETDAEIDFDVAINGTSWDFDLIRAT